MIIRHLQRKTLADKVKVYHFRGKNNLFLLFVKSISGLKFNYEVVCSEKEKEDEESLATIEHAVDNSNICVM